MWQAEISINLGLFLSLYSPNNPENQNFEKTKKHLCIFNKCYSYNHMMYDSWNMECNRKYFCHFGSFFAFSPSSPIKKKLKRQKKIKKIRILKKCKKLLEISSFYICEPKIMITWCMVPEIWSETDRIICHFGLFLILLSHY